MTLLDIRIPVRDMVNANHPSLVAWAKAGLKPAKDELERRKAITDKYHTPLKSKTEWEARGQVIDFDPSRLNED